MGISEDSITASLPPAWGQDGETAALEMQVTLCRILAKVDLSRNLHVQFKGLLG